MPEYKFKITEKWSQEHVFVAETLEEAQELAQEFQDNYDIDLTKADYQSGHVEFIAEVPNEIKT